MASRLVIEVQFKYCFTVPVSINYPRAAKFCLDVCIRPVKMNVTVKVIGRSKDP